MSDGGFLFVLFALLVLSFGGMIYAISQCEDQHECAQDAAIGMAIGLAASKK